MRSVVVIGTVLVVSASSAFAQQVQGLCGDREEMQTQLSQRFNEEPTRYGMIGTGVMVELLTSDSGSWTAVLSFPDGRSCLIDHGEAQDRRGPPPLGRSR